MSDPAPPPEGSVHFCTYCTAHLVQTTAVMGFIIPTVEHGDIQINLCKRHLTDAVRELTESLTKLTPNKRSQLILPGTVGPTKAH